MIRLCGAEPVVLTPCCAQPIYQFGLHRCGFYRCGFYRFGFYRCGFYYCGFFGVYRMYTRKYGAAIVPPNALLATRRVLPAGLGEAVEEPGEDA